MQTGRFTYRTVTLKHKHSLILICTLYSSCALAGPRNMNSALFDRIVQEPWQSSGSPVMITERTRSNRNEMEQNGTNPKTLELTIGPSEPMQNDQTCFFSNIFLKFYNIIKIII
jgi:hypothetical protein